ncbi:MAG TPA: replication-associated recombination protein A [Candidatus Saccharicenans sp.]|nr:replication-associated recombination protein A [Candidatus Saccharicenans sp.]HQO75789.1 replication-associated recombination protein A [Candidatus Saccharicenans sp.]HUM79415.1 replication-associated recombination protein A [Candidatus Saccharicenans sp.]
MARPVNRQDKRNQARETRHVPLAERMRPQTFDRFYGQEHLLGPGKILTELIDSGQLVSIIFWGPPGSGKTTLGIMLAKHFGLNCLFFSAVLSGIKEIKEVMAQAEQQKKMYGQPLIIFIDEIHRFNKAQQSAFLPYVERGDVILFGSTTENPSFEVIAPLLSRTRVLVLKPLDKDALRKIIHDALTDEINGLGQLHLSISDEAVELLYDQSNGDARRALNALEIAASLTRSQEITVKEVEESLQKRTLVYDKSGEEHYNLISALHKSLRNSDVDASLYWLARMLYAGEDPLYIARRLIRFASEDIGLADPQALALALQAKEAYDFLGSPEGELALAEAVVYLASAPKSNRVYAAFGQAMKEVEESPFEPVPLNIRNAVTPLMKELGYGEDYEYAHDSPLSTTDMETFPERLKGKKYYHPGHLGFEKEIKKRIDWWEALKERIRKEKTSKE